jgi:phage FluMu protein Com
MQPVPITALPRHEAFCERNNIHCTKCNRVFLKTEYSQHWHCTEEDCLFVDQVTRSRKHLDMIHTPLDCSCGIQLLLPQIATHKKTSCPSRYIICRYCHLLVQAGEKSTNAKDLMLGLNVGEHESTCGGRTIQCVKCSKNVQLKGINR